MFNLKLFCTAIFTLVLIGPVAAQRLEVTSIPHATVDRPMGGNDDNSDAALLNLAADWISSVFALPKLQSLPAIRRFSAERFALLSNTDVSGSVPDTAVLSYQQVGREMVANYDDASKTIEVPYGWNGSTPAQMSILVHAMVHHFQNVSGRKYFDCPEERKALPYEAQDRWLGLYGRSLSEDFKINPGMLVLITQCMP